MNWYHVKAYVVYDLCRRSVLVSELSLEKLFSAGIEECQKLQAREGDLRAAILKARHVRQVPMLETYCRLDKVFILVP